MDVSRFVNTEKLDFEVEFVTPAFWGGADQNAEMRCSSFKTGIRYWWRVLYANDFSEDSLKKNEDEIFGSTEKASLLRISLSKVGELKVAKDGFPKGRKCSASHQGRPISFNILDYLAFGKCNYHKEIRGNSYDSTYFTASQKFKCSIQLPTDSKTQGEVKNAIKAFIAFGGIGAKSRNGFGSMYSNELSKLSWTDISDIQKNPLVIPVISNKSKLYITKQSFNTWEEALSEIGCIYKEARCSVEKPHIFERRGLIARPIATGESVPYNIKKDRSPKNIYLHVNKENGNKFRGQILVLPIKYPDATKIDEYDEVFNKVNTVFKSKMQDITTTLFKNGGAK